MLSILWNPYFIDFRVLTDCLLLFVQCHGNAKEIYEDFGARSRYLRHG